LGDWARAEESVQTADQGSILRFHNQRNDTPAENATVAEHQHLMLPRARHIRLGIGSTLKTQPWLSIST
jgi:hypothetical protein